DLRKYQNRRRDGKQGKSRHGAPHSSLPVPLPLASEVPHSYWSRGASAAVVGRVALTGGFARPVAESARATGSAAFTGILAVVLQLRRADRVGLIIRLRRRCRRVAGMVRHHRGGLV